MNYIQLSQSRRVWLIVGIIDRIETDWRRVEEMGCDGLGLEVRGVERGWRYGRVCATYKFLKWRDVMLSCKRIFIGWVCSRYLIRQRRRLLHWKCGFRINFNKWFILAVGSCRSRTINLSLLLLFLKQWGI